MFLETSIYVWDPLNRCLNGDDDPFFQNAIWETLDDGKLVASISGMWMFKPSYYQTCSNFGLHFARTGLPVRPYTNEEYQHHMKLFWGSCVIL